jgi:hypothetical protein
METKEPLPSVGETRAPTSVSRMLGALATIALVLSLITSKPLLESLFSKDGSIEYPNDLYVYSIQIVLSLAALGLTATALLARSRYGRAVMYRFHAASDHGRGLYICSLLVAAEFLLLCGHFLTATRPKEGLAYHLFHLGHEWNLPTFFSVGQLILAAALAYSCAKSWSGLWNRVVLLLTSVVLAYLAIDELLQLHEHWGAAGRHLFQFLMHDTTYVYGQHGALWTYIGLAVALPMSASFAFGYWRMLKNQRILFVPLAFAGSLYILGAAGFENINAITEDSRGIDPLLVAEEWLEMFGATVAVYFFLRLRRARPAS